VICLKKQNLSVAIGAAAGMLIIIFDSKTALRGASEGIALCLNILIPSLFPFFFLSIILTASLSGQVVSILQPLTAACGIPNGAQSLLPICLLGGYPVGAQNISLLYRQGQLSQAGAMRLIAFCNNAGPAFIFGVLGPMFINRIMPWLLWLIHLCSALSVGLLIPSEKSEHIVQFPDRRIRITDALLQSVKTMSLVCGWVVVMRIVLTFMDTWFLWFFPRTVGVILTGILELSNGCIRLAELDCEGLRFLIASAFLSLGGICVTLQTASIAEGIPLKLYFPGKMLQASISIFMSYVFQFVLPQNIRFRCDWIALASVTIILFIATVLLHTENNSRIPVMIDV